MTTFFLGMAAGTLCTLSFIPQVVRIYRTKNVRDISLMTFVILSVGTVVWFIYGVLIKEWPVIIANAVTFVLVLLILSMKIRYRQRQETEGEK
jgi:MtN3 and saliva related transmembrane protein